MRRVLVVFPTGWDFKQIPACRGRWSGEYEVEFGKPTDVDCPCDFDVLSYVDETARRMAGRFDGVVSSSDYPGATVAGAIAAAAGLPGCPPEKVLACSHKYYSRLAQREAVPDAVPAFDLVDPEKEPKETPSTGFPCFLKPVKGAFSVLARRIENAEELDSFLRHPAVVEFTRHYLLLFNRLVARYTDYRYDGRYFLAEELLRGDLVTVEGYACGAEIHVFGVVDSVVDLETRSFVRFDYPSALPEEVKGEMREIVRRAVAGLGLRDTLFNVELMRDPETGRIAIVEVNPRMCGQFADLYEKVDGKNAYEIAFDLATGRPPAFERRGGEFAVASSVPLRLFSPGKVVRAPTESALAEIERREPGTLVWQECREGDVLSDFESAEDGKSIRYAVFNAGGANPQALARRIETVRDLLGYRFEPLPTGSGSR